VTDSKPALPALPALPTPTDLPTSYDFTEIRGSARLVDLDGMNIIADIRTSPTMNVDLDLEPVEEIPAETITEIQRNRQVDVHDWENNPATASWGPLMQEVCALWSVPAVSIEC
jgi:hypothetical protein